MAATDFVRRSMQIVAGGIVGSTTDYFDNAITFVNDVKEVIDMGKQMGSSGAKKFNELRQAGMFKKARDWFYNEGGSFGDFDFDDDDDGGFEIDSADSEKKETDQPLSKQMMTDIAKKQTGAMYKAFGKQADLQIANTAEIVSTINTRTAELTASVNNVNNTLIQIGKRLDLIVEWTSARTKKEEEQERKASIIDYGGGISLSGVVNKFKENAEDSLLGTMLSMGKTMMTSGMLTPEMVMSFILSQTVMEKKWKKLDNKSINEIGEFVNDTVGEAIQNVMTKVLTSKNGFLENLFDDIINKTSGKNYQNSVTNQYNDKPAVFDGMTRKSIITIIPGYLNEILKAVTNGPGMNINDKGNLTAKKSDSFVKQISDSYFRPGTVGYKERDRAVARTQLSDRDVSDAIRTMTGCWVWHMYAYGRNVLEIGEVKDLGRASTRDVLANTAKLMAKTTNISEEEWLTKYLPAIVASIDEFKYRQELQHANSSADKELERFAKTHVNGSLAGQVTWDKFEQAFASNFTEYHPNEPGAAAKATQIGSTSGNSTGITPFDTTLAILDKLNMGLNVFITGQSDIRKQPYDAVILKPRYAQNRHVGPAKEGKQSVIPAPVDKLMEAKKAVDAKRSTGDERYDELNRRIANGETLSKEEQKEYNKKKKELGLTFGGKVKQKLGLFADESRKTHIVDPTMNELSEIFGEGFDKIKNSKLVQKVFGSKAGQNITAGVGATADVIGDAVLGKRTWDQQGNAIRKGGLAHKAVVKGEKIGTSLKNATKSTQALQEETEEFLSNYGPDKQIAPDDHNGLYMQMLQSMFSSSMADGDYSNIDEQAANTIMAKIDDKDIQRQLKQTVVPLMKRNSKSNKSGSGSGEKGKSSLAMIGKIAWGLGKMVLRPIITYVKLIAFSVIGIVKGVGGKLLKFLKWGVSSGVRDIVSGVKSIGSGLKKVFAPVSKFINKTLQHATNVINKINGWMSKIGQGISKVFSGIGKLFSRNKTKVSQSQGKPGEMPDLYDTGKKGVFGSMGDRFKNSNFGSGFMKAFNDRKEAQKKATVKEQAAPINQALKDSKVESILQDTTGKKGMLAPIVDGLGKIIDKLPDKPKENPGTTTDTAGKEKEDKSKTSTTGTAQKGGTSTMPDLYAGNKGSAGGGGSTSTMPEVGSARSTDLGGNAAGGGAGGKSGGGGAAKGIGETLGGIASSVGGVLKIAITILSFFEAGRALIKFVKNLLIESLKPLNDVIQSIAKVLKPILKQLGGIIKQLAQFIVQVVDVLVDVIKPILEDVIKPILEVISPLLEAILGAIVPILKIVGIVLKVILAPLMGLFKFVLLPILKIIGDAVQIIMGVLQIGFGVLMMGIGGIISAIGGLISLVGKIPLLGAVGNVGEGILNTGKDMMTQGKDFVVQGGKSVAQGAVNLVLDYASLYTLGASDELLGRNQEEDKKETKKIEAVDDDTVKKTVANGDITNIYNTYGGEYQRGMGGYLNMNQRGCGPIALADMYNRHGGEMSSRSLAGSMYSSGNYDPRRGTSVGGYIDSARSLGMNLTPGKVTQQSLKSASPSNPITVVGSGSDYGTRNGNNHFMNVIGTDHHGGAYVSNPLTGRIDRKPASTIAGSAVLGLYGSGDTADGSYTFPEAIKSAFAKLKEEANKILGMFSMEKSEEEETEERINSEQKKQAVEQAKKQMGDEYDKYVEEAKSLAFDDYKTKYPKKDNETDEEYQKKFDDWWENTADQAEYLAKTELLDKASEGNKDAWQTLQNTSQSFVDSYAGKVDENGNLTGGLFDKLGDAYTQLNEDTKSLGGPTSSGGGGSGYFTSDDGVEMWVPYSDNIEITETDINKGPYNAPLFEFFAKTMGLNLGDVYGSGWFKHYNGPNKEGEGQTPDDGHSGIDFAGGGILGKPLYATTGGTVKAVWSPSESGGGGNTVVWEDDAGKLHWYMHMTDIAPGIVKDGTIDGGTLIGHVGYTGSVIPAGVGGTHLHYTINDTLAGSGSGHVYNPLMYFHNYNPSGGAQALGDTDEEKIFSYLTTSGMTPIGAAGLMGCFKYESDMRTDNLENSYNDQFGMSDAEYTNAVNNGQESEQQFITGRNATAWAGQTPGAAVGYGIAQFTSQDLKRGIYDRTVKKGKSIASLEPQLDAIMDVLKQRGIYDTINNAKTPTDANKTFLWKYEAGTGYTSDEAVLNAYPWMLSSNPNGVILRHNYAEQVYNTYKDWSPKKADKQMTVNSPGDARILNNQQMTGSTSGEGTGVVNIRDGVLNVRKDKSTSSDIIATLNPGETIDIKACGSSQWLYVPSLDGYVSADYIAVTTNDDIKKDYNDTPEQKQATKNYLASYAENSTGNQKQFNEIDDKMWNAANWLAPKSNASERSKWYKQLANIHAKTIKNNQLTYTQQYKDAWTWAKDDGKRVTPDTEAYWQALMYQMSHDQHFSTLGIGKSDVDLTWNGVKDEAYSGGNSLLKKWSSKGKDVKAYKGNGKYADAIQTRLNRQLADIKGLRKDWSTWTMGSGDEPMSELDFWNDYLGWNNKYASSNYVTPGTSDSYNDTGTYWDAETGTTVVNNYQVTRAEDTATDARIRAILANTYNVRSESMEYILAAILEELQRRRESGGGGNDTSGSTKLFDERIPSQVTKLSIG